MDARNGRKARAPLDQDALERLALRYVERFATTRSKLGDYLTRKLRERGWKGDAAADVDGMVQRLAGLGYVDDAAFALSKSRSLSARGYGAGRIGLALRVAGVDEADGAAAKAHAVDQSVEAALRFARKRRIGPFAPEIADPKQRERALSAMIRAGHAFALAKSILDLRPGTELNPDDLFDESRTAID
jgi:regulatory protein